MRRPKGAARSRCSNRSSAPAAFHATPRWWCSIRGAAWGIGAEGGRSTPRHPPLGNPPRPLLPPLGIGNREWGIDKAVRPLPPHPHFIKSRESTSPFPIPTIPHSRLPIPKGGVVGQGTFSATQRPSTLPCYALRHPRSVQRHLRRHDAWGPAGRRT